MYDGIMADLIDELGRLPGIGPKSAQRLAFHILQAEPADVRRLAEVLVTPGTPVEAQELLARYADA